MVTAGQSIREAVGCGQRPVSRFALHSAALTVPTGSGMNAEGLPGWAFPQNVGPQGSKAEFS